MAETPSPVQKFYYQTVLKPKFQIEMEQLGTAASQYHNYILALSCLKKAAGPGVDPLDVAEFASRWKNVQEILNWPTRVYLKQKGVPVPTSPSLTPTNAVRSIGERVAPPIRPDGETLFPSATRISLFDITQSLNFGTQLIAQMTPLLGKFRMDAAQQICWSDRSVVPENNKEAVLKILDSTDNPKTILQQAEQSKKSFEAKWGEVAHFAKELDSIDKEINQKATSPEVQSPETPVLPRSRPLNSLGIGQPFQQQQILQTQQMFQLQQLQQQQKLRQQASERQQGLLKESQERLQQNLRQQQERMEQQTRNQQHDLECQQQMLHQQQDQMRQQQTVREQQRNTQERFNRHQSEERVKLEIRERAQIANNLSARHGISITGQGLAQKENQNALRNQMLHAAKQPVESRPVPTQPGQLPMERARPHSLLGSIKTGLSHIFSGGNHFAHRPAPISFGPHAGGPGHPANLGGSTGGQTGRGSGIKIGPGFSGLRPINYTICYGPSNNGGGAMVCHSFSHR